MKKHVQILFLSVVMIAANLRSNAQTIIHYWNFNNFTSKMYTDTIHGINADYSDLDKSKAQILYAEMSGVSSSFSTYEDFYPTVAADYDTVNLQLGDTAGNALRPRNPSDSMYLLFYIPTTNFKNISLKYGSESSSVGSGMLHQIFDYSVDSGVNWKTSGLSIPSDSAWLIFHLTSINFSDTLVNNNPKMVFRIAFNGNTSGTSGNNRFDNVTVEGDSIGGTGTTPSGVVQVVKVTPSYNLFPNPVSNTLDINGNIDGLKSIVIYNTLGETVYSSSVAGKNLTLNVADLKAGNYFIDITEKISGVVSTLKFIKQ